MLEKSQCLVIKIGSSLLINEDQQTINTPWLVSLVEDIAELANTGCKVIIVTSGAIAYGKITLGLTQKQLSLDTKQAASAVGQIGLMHAYQTLLNQQGKQSAQVLLTLDDTELRSRYINLRNTLTRLLQLNVIPIINENDSVATAEIRYGDNDRLAARVAQMIGADTLILLSDIDGLYSDNPYRSSDARFIKEVHDITPEIMSMAKDSNGAHGTGGMLTKLDAAKIAMHCGCKMLITAGKPKHPIKHFEETGRGTWFYPNSSLKKAKKTWLQDHLKSFGAITVDEGAATALASGASLLAIGITDIAGHFEKGAVISILDENQHKIAAGLVNYNSQTLMKIKRKNSKEIDAILGCNRCDEVIHRDNMVIF